MRLQAWPQKQVMRCTAEEQGPVSCHADFVQAWCSARASQVPGMLTHGAAACYVALQAGPCL